MRGFHLVAVFVRWGAILLAAVVWIAGCDSATEPPTAEPPGAEPPSPVRVEAATATELTGTVGAEVTPAPTVRATDARGSPVPGVAISFEVGSGGGAIAENSVETDAQGLATVGKWTLGPVVGTYELAASSAELAHVVFTARAEAGLLAQITRVSGDGQSAVVGDKLPKPLWVRVADSFGNKIAARRSRSR